MEILTDMGILLLCACWLY